MSTLGIPVQILAALKNSGLLGGGGPDEAQGGGLPGGSTPAPSAPLTPSPSTAPATDANTFVPAAQQKVIGVPQVGPPAPQPVPSGEPTIPPVLDSIIGRVPGTSPAEPPPTDEEKGQDVMDKLTSAGTNQPNPKLAPPAPPQKSLMQRALPFIQLAGAIGAGGANAFDRRDEGRTGQQLEQAIAGQRAAALKQQELQQVEVPKAKAYSDYMSGRNETQENVAGTRATAQQNVANTNVAGRANVANINASSKMQIAALQQGAPMTISPQMAQIAGQPDLAGVQLSGKSLANFMKTFTAAGAAIHDLGEEGLWAVDRMGNRIQRVAVSSPSVARAREFAAARAANTPVNVLTWDENGTPSLKAISQAQQLKTGTPTAQVEQGILGPTSQTRTMGQMASTVTPHLNVLRAEVQELSPYLGPMMGRLVTQGLAGKLGSTGDPQLDAKMGQLISDFKLASSAVGRTHFAGRTGLPAAQYFESLFNAARSPEEILGILNSVPQYIEGYASNSAIAPQPRVGGAAQFGNTQQMQGGGKPLKQIDEATATSYLQKAGGDKNKARAAAKADGYKF